MMETRVYNELNIILAVCALSCMFNTKPKFAPNSSHA